LPANLGLKETLAVLRRGQRIPVGKKVLIVLDQFEQWLYVKKEEEHTDLVQALRQCDGGRVQCIVMVRDDFWMAVIRFMRELEIRLLEGQNSATVDLFDLVHARKVLASFGRAFGKLPENTLTKEQEEFLNQAVSGLAQEGKVICVRLALFAEMMKGKAWTPSTLKEVGGTAGVGVILLEETFSAATAPPEHRYHQTAAKEVLKALLPESGTDMRGHMRSYAELLVVSGYANRPKDFDDLLRILNSEIRLITPTDPEGKETAEDNSSPVQPGEQYYQLTHDYLVPSLLTWLTRMEKESRRDRIKLLLVDRAEVWNARPTNRQLPSFLEWITILCLTQKESWTKPQWKLMRKATRYHIVRGLLIAVILGMAACLGCYEAQGRLFSRALRDRLLDANTNEVPTIEHDMAPCRRWLDPLLHEAYVQTEKENHARKQLHASLALLPVDSGQVEYLSARLLDAEPGDVGVIRSALAPHKEELVRKFWVVVESPEKGMESSRLRAAAALAMYDPNDPRWERIQGLVANDLVTTPASDLAVWLDSFRPVRGKLLPALYVIFIDDKRRESERFLATDILAHYAEDQPQVMSDLLMNADEQQFAVLFSKFQAHGSCELAVNQDELEKTLPPDAMNSARERLAQRQANAAAYCNWLSKKDGIPKDQWCYEPVREGKHTVGMRMAANYLQRTGYRLSTEAEWEYACRAGAPTSRYYGETAKLLIKKRMVRPE
jgi:hypothetical protein